MRYGDFFAVFCFESQIDLTTWSIKKSYSTPSLNIAVVKTKCVEGQIQALGGPSQAVRGQSKAQAGQSQAQENLSQALGGLW